MRWDMTAHTEISGKKLNARHYTEYVGCFFFSYLIKHIQQLHYVHESKLIRVQSQSAQPVCSTLSGFSVHCLQKWRSTWMNLWHLWPNLRPHWLGSLMHFIPRCRVHRLQHSFPLFRWIKKIKSVHILYIKSLTPRLRILLITYCGPLMQLPAINPDYIRGNDKAGAINFCLFKR